MTLRNAVTASRFAAQLFDRAQQWEHARRATADATATRAAALGITDPRQVSEARGLLSAAAGVIVTADYLAVAFQREALDAVEHYLEIALDLPAPAATDAGQVADQHGTQPLVPPFRIKQVYDTRQFIEVDDRWVPVPGTGDERECDRCGRLHEIHAEVFDATGPFAVVGVGCMNATSNEQRRLSSKATRNAKKAAKQQAQAAARAEFDAHAATVAALPFPRDEVRRQPITWGGKPAEEWRVQDAGPVIADQWADPEERMRCLESTWRERRMQQRVGGPDALRALERRVGTRYWG